MTSPFRSAYRHDRDTEQTAEQFERMTLGLALEHEPGATVARLRVTVPRLSGTNAEPFRKRAYDVIAEGVTLLVIDLSVVVDIDAKGYGALASAGNALKRAHGRCVVTGAKDYLRDVFAASHLTPQCFEVLP